MKTLFVSFLALAACAEAEEAKGVTKKRGLADDIGYGNIQLSAPVGLGQIGHGVLLEGITSAGGFGLGSGYGYGHGQIAQLQGIGLLGSGIGLGSVYSQAGPGLIGLGGGYSFAPQEIVLGGPPKLNSYNTGYGLGAYAGDAFVQKQLASGIGSRVPQVFPIQDPRDLTVTGPQVISTNPGTQYGFKYTQAAALPVGGPVTGFRPIPAALSQPQPLSVSVPASVAYAPPVQAPVQQVVSYPAPLPAPAPQLTYSRPPSQPGIAFGSGSLGITQLKNGNYALGSGSIGYAASLGAAAATPSVQAALPAQIQLSGSYATPDYLKGY